MAFLVDTNVVSELVKAEPAAEVIAWMEENGSKSFISSITIEELRFGVLFLPEGKRKRKLTGAIDLLIESYASSTWSFDALAAEQCAQFHAFAIQHGRTPAIEDLMIASIARCRDVPVVTRNVKDFSYLGVKVVNPFSS